MIGMTAFGGGLSDNIVDTGGSLDRLRMAPERGLFLCPNGKCLGEIRLNNERLMDG